MPQVVMKPPSTGKGARPKGGSSLVHDDGLVDLVADIEDQERHCWKITCSTAEVLDASCVSCSVAL